MTIAEAVSEGGFDEYEVLSASRLPVVLNVRSADGWWRTARLYGPHDLQVDEPRPVDRHGARAVLARGTR